MSELELYGLLAVAKEQQKAVEKAAADQRTAAELLARTVEQLAIERATIPGAVTKAAQDAARAALGAMVGEMQGAAKESRLKLTEAAQEAAAEVGGAMRGVSLAWVLCAFGLGLGVGGAGVWVLFAKQFDRIEVSASRAEAASLALWRQSPEGKTEAAKAAGK